MQTINLKLYYHEKTIPYFMHLSIWFDILLNNLQISIKPKCKRLLGSCYN